MESVILSLVNRYSTEQKKDYFFKIIIKKAETKMHIELQQAYLCFICFLIPLLIIALFFMFITAAVGFFQNVSAILSCDHIG